MATDTEYSINHSKIVFEKFEDELVLINLDNGNYFSIRNVASLIWDLLDKGLNVQELSFELSKSFGKTEEEIQTDIKQFVDQLLVEGLIGVSDTKSTEIVKLDDTDFSNIEYGKPVLEVYSDMQDLILLDPIHEVDETGWPNVKQEKETSEN